MIRHLIVIIALTCGLVGCSSRQLYDSAASWRQQECDRIVDATERSRCLETANLEYERYRREREKAGEAR
ncbi:hypothetical protein [Methyloversatilis discipulorum]|uniref:hypothetical protein n=1 Tax=Methyloversatilis discipulorum TaxID=1119528 RepID=UPI00036D463A|nr:hypothetical protein [Methyloversatilis discipulorum]